MAKCFPEIFPTHKSKDPKLRAERVAYKALCEQLPNEYTVFYSASWQGAGRGGHKRDCEIDFLVVHPVKGILILELKGGGITYDANQDQFFSHSAGGKSYSIKNPYDQAKTNKYLLLDKLKSRRDWDRGKIAMAHGVIFPDVNQGVGSQGLPFPQELTMYVNDLENVLKKIEDIFLYEAERVPHVTEQLQVSGVEYFKNLFARSFELKIPMIVGLRADEDRIIQLTERQFAILDFLSFQRRALIKGGAGTGKTILAIEKAKRLAIDGFRTLLLCYNKSLATFIQSSIQNNINFNADTFHGFCLKLSYESGLLRPGGVPQDPAFYNDALPEILLQALDKTENRYDAIIIDEGQDFRANWWEPIQFALSDPDDGILYIFYDDYQRVMLSDEKPDYPIDTQPFILNQNLRNTKAIFESAKLYSPESLTVNSGGPEGTAVERISIKSQDRDLAKAISKVLHRLVNVESVPISDIVILTGKDQKSTLLNGMDQTGVFNLSFGGIKKGCVFMDTVRRFKGLERSVVIFVEYGAITTNNALMYVAMTRARTHLIMIES